MESEWNKKKEEKWPLLERPFKIDLNSKLNSINKVNNLKSYIRYFKENISNTKNAQLSTNCVKKLRPKSMVYLKPSLTNYTNESFQRMKSAHQSSELF